MNFFRSLTFDLVETDRRQAFGCLLPWDTAQIVSNNGGLSFFVEQHARASVLVTPGLTIPVYDDHAMGPNGEMIRGPHVADVVELDDRPDGLYGRVVMRAGHDTLPARSFSVEFEGLASYIDGNGVVTFIRSRLTGLAFTNQPQYPDARVLSFRANHQGDPAMNHQQPYPQPGNFAPPPAPAQQAQQYPQQQAQQYPAQQQQAPQQQFVQQQQQQPTQQQFTSVQQQPAVQQLDPGVEHARAAAAAQTVNGGGQQPAPQAMPTNVRVMREEPQFRSVGEFMLANALGKIEVQERDRYFRALATSTTADVPGLIKENWVNEIVDFVGTQMPLVTAFSQIPVPTSGMTITYPRVTQKPLVQKQAAQLDEVGSRKITVSKTSINIDTYAGGSRASLQEIQRSDPAYLTMLYELDAEEMARAMDVAAIAALAAAVPAGNKALPGAALTVANFKLLNGFVVAAIKKLFVAMVSMDLAFVVGVDLWEMFAAAVDGDGRPLFPHINGMNPLGRIDISDPLVNGGEIRSLPFTVDGNMTATKGYLGWKRAFTTFLGPVQTRSADVVANLAQDSVVFEEAAFAARRPDALYEFTLT